MSRRFAAICVVAGGLLLLAGSAAAQEVPPVDPELQELIETFQTELAIVAAELDLPGPESLLSGDVLAGLDALIGEPGRRDLPPGEALFLGVIVAATSPEAVGLSSDAALTGPCQGFALSFDGDGDLIDAAADFDDDAPPVDISDLLSPEPTIRPAFTADNPFEVDVNGVVIYAGRTDPAPIDHNWRIRTQGISLDSGGDPNRGAENRNAGSVNLADDFPVKVNALFRIDGSMEANDGFRCAGEGYFRTVGGLPILGGVGLVLVAAAGAGALFNARPARTWRG